MTTLSQLFHDSIADGTKNIPGQLTDAQKRQIDALEDFVQQQLSGPDFTGSLDMDARHGSIVLLTFGDKNKSEAVIPFSLTRDSFGGKPCIHFQVDSSLQNSDAAYDFTSGEDCKRATILLARETVLQMKATTNEYSIYEYLETKTPSPAPAVS